MLWMESSSEDILLLPSTVGTVYHSLVSQHLVRAGVVPWTCQWVGKQLGDGLAAMRWVGLLDLLVPSASEATADQGCTQGVAVVPHCVLHATHRHLGVMVHLSLLHTGLDQGQICLP